MRTPAKPLGTMSFMRTCHPRAAASRVSRSLTAPAGKVRCRAKRKAKAKKAP
jgi:hypothetical protein